MKRAAMVMMAAAISGLGIASANASTSAKSASAASPVVSTHIGTPARMANLAVAQPKIIQLLCNLTNDAVTPNSFRSLNSNFDPANAQRIGKSAGFGQGYGAALNAQIEQFSRNWKAKYGTAFNVAATPDVFEESFTWIRTGMPGHDPKLLTEVNSAAGRGTNSAANNAQAFALADVHWGRHGEIRVPLICDNSGNWRIEAPGSVDAAKLRSNLTHQLTELNQHSAHWPAKEVDGYRQVVRHVLVAVLNQPTKNTQAAAK